MEQWHHHQERHRWNKVLWAKKNHKGPEQQEKRLILDVRTSARVATTRVGWWWWYLLLVLGLQQSWVSLLGGAESFILQPHIWSYQGQHPIAYERAVFNNNKVDNSNEDHHRKNKEQLRLVHSQSFTPLVAIPSQPFQEELESTTTITTTTTTTMTMATTLVQDSAPLLFSSQAMQVEDDCYNLNQSTTRATLDSTPILFLNGFGVGSFHQHRLVRALKQLEEQEEEDDDNTNDNHTRSRRASRKVYCMDYLGQGKSWPSNCDDGNSPSEQGLRYCGNTWVDQIVHFIDQVILVENPAAGKVHIVGNSVGGHLAVFVAALRPKQIASLCLLNATPVWGLNLPGWTGYLPAPLFPKWIGRYLFDRIRDDNTIRNFLQNCYVNADAYSEKLIKQIRSGTEGRGGHAAFASILWSPPITVPIPTSISSCVSNNHKNKDNDNKSNSTTVKQANFYQCLQALQCDVLLMYGREDPWCKPAFAKRVLQALDQRQQRQRRADQHPHDYIHRYVELSNVGHCPNHEAPQAVAHVLYAWLHADDIDPDRTATAAVAASNDHHHHHDRSSLRSEQSLDLLRNGYRSTMSIQERWGVTMLHEKKQDEISLTWAEHFAMAFV